jgi:hypothetical protein
MVQPIDAVNFLRQDNREYFFLQATTAVQCPTLFIHGGFAPP